MIMILSAHKLKLAIWRNVLNNEEVESSLQHHV